MNHEAIDELKKVDTPIGVFSVCGAAGIGKSYLLNCILDLIGEGKREKGFGTIRPAAQGGFGSTPDRPAQPGTKGVWMLGRPLYVENRDMHIIVLDF